MGIYEFNQLSFDEKANALWEHGVFLLSRDEGQQHKILYQISNFFGEIVYDHPSNSIVEIGSFRSNTRLEEYLGCIVLSELIGA